MNAFLAVFAGLFLIGVGAACFRLLAHQHSIEDPDVAVDPEDGQEHQCRVSFVSEPVQPGDWPEDFSHENGNYQNKCCHCGVIFVGHKRRVVCKVCATPQ